MSLPFRCTICDGENTVNAFPLGAQHQGTPEMERPEAVHGRFVSLLGAAMLTQAC